MPMHSRALSAAVFACASFSLLSPVASARPAAAQDAPESVALLVEQAPQPSRAPLAVDIASLTLESDFTVFMKPDCPEQLRASALRRLWSLLPQAAPDENSAI